MNIYDCKLYKRWIIIKSLVMLCLGLSIIQSCVPNRGGAPGGVGNPCGGSDTRLAADGSAGEDAKVSLSVYSELSYGSQLTWKKGNTSSHDSSSISSCTSVVSLEEENGELIAYLGTSYHCVRNMAEQYVDEEADEFAIYLNVAPESECKTQVGEQAQYVRVPFEINTSVYLSKLIDKIRSLKSNNLYVDVAQHDRQWLEKSFHIINPHDKKMLAEMKNNLKLSDDIVAEIDDFNKSFDRYSCTTSPKISAEKIENTDYQDFHDFIRGLKKSEPNARNKIISNSCFLSSDVVFFKVSLDPFYLNSKSVHKCLETSHLTTENSEKESVPIQLNIGNHPQHQSEWSKAVVSFHDEAVEWDSQDQQSITTEAQEEHRSRFDNIMKKTFQKVEDIINQGTESESDDLKVIVHEIGNNDPDQYHLYFLTFFKNSADEHLNFQKLKLAYNKHQKDSDTDLMALFGRIYAIFFRHWGVSLVLSGLQINPGSSGSLLISGNEITGYEIMAALYSKNGSEYSSPKGPIHRAYGYSKIKSQPYTTRPSDDDDGVETSRPNNQNNNRVATTSPRSGNTAADTGMQRSPQPRNTLPVRNTSPVVDSDGTKPNKDGNKSAEVQDTNKPENSQHQEEGEQENEDRGDLNLINDRDDADSTPQLDCR